MMFGGGSRSQPGAVQGVPRLCSVAVLVAGCGHVRLAGLAGLNKSAILPCVDVSIWVL